MRSRKIILCLPSVIFAILIFVLSHLPSDLIPPNVFNLQDKLLHAFVFFLFGISLLIAFSNVNNKRKVLILVFLIGSIYGMLDELHQLYVPGRVCDITDWMADSFGVAISLFFRAKVQAKVHSIFFKKQ
jgi:Predicted integral membrane protein